MRDRVSVRPHSWWDDVPYFGEEQSPFSMQIEAEPVFSHPCGFISLKERHRVRAERTQTNAEDRRCRIGRVRLR